jgi:hypothetical protein
VATDASTPERVRALARKFHWTADMDSFAPPATLASAPNATTLAFGGVGGGVDYDAVGLSRCRRL